MNAESKRSFDVAVIGGGPAGMGAATVAAECGLSVVLLDDNPGLGGQIWRGESGSSKHTQASHWFDRVGRSSVEWILEARVFQVGKGHLSAESPDTVHQIAYSHLILATGARERFLPFPGWTLPNVLGAGALHSLIKSGLPVEGKRIVIAGTGPLLLAVAAYAREKGAQVACIAEQTTGAKFACFGLSVLLVPEELEEVWQLAWQLQAVPHWKNCWPVAALGKERLEAVRLSHHGRIREIASDNLAFGFNLVPSLELAQFIGCAIQDGYVAVDENQQTCIPGVYCAGEPTGIGGFELALVEGQIAGFAAANRKDLARKLWRRRDAGLRHVRALRRAFELRDELRNMPQEDTLVCRCEDVPFGLLRAHQSWQSAKLHSRCGMGPCQGRVCGAAAEFLFGWSNSSVRPPLFPVRCSSLAEMPVETIPEIHEGGSK
jgi:NADPH-dependent 2,4-dienoyl-CoA reductase/sulfur reductase-like enzyme